MQGAPCIQGVVCTGKAFFLRHHGMHPMQHDQGDLSVPHDTITISCTRRGRVQWEGHPQKRGTVVKGHACTSGVDTGQDAKESRRVTNLHCIRMNHGTEGVMGCHARVRVAHRLP